AELVMATLLAVASAMREACDTGDFHTANSEALLGHAPTRDERKHMKPVGFGLIYLGTPWTIRKNMRVELGIDLPEDQANQFFVRFWDRYTGYLQWIDRVKAEARTGLVLSPFGRAYPTRPLKDLEAVRFMVNGLIQGATGDLTARALVRVHQAGLRPLVEVHDSIGVSSTPEGAQEAATVLQEAMEDDLVPITAEVTVADRWHEVQEAVPA